MSKATKKSKAAKTTRANTAAPKAKKTQKATTPAKNGNKATLAKPVAQVAKTKKPSGLDAAARVLKEAGKAMRCKEIVDTVLKKGYWKTSGKTPTATIYAAIIREIRYKGKASRFVKLAGHRGLFSHSAG